MDLFSGHFFVLTLALVGAVIIVAALLSGLIDRSDLPQVAVFLAFGAILGPAGLDLLHVSLDSPILRVVATLSLVLVLFTDAVRCRLRGPGPVAAALSGGLDSSAVVCVAREVQAAMGLGPLPTYTARFPTIPSRSSAVTCS